jgi:hypothetical protein
MSVTDRYCDAAAFRTIFSCPMSRFGKKRTVKNRYQMKVVTLYASSTPIVIERPCCCKGDHITSNQVAKFTMPLQIPLLVNV